MSEEYLKRLYWALRSSKTKKNNSIGTMPCIWLVQVPHMDISFVLILGVDPEGTDFVKAESKEG